MRKRFLQITFLTCCIAAIGLMVTSRCFGNNTSGKVEPFLPEIVSQFPDVRDIAISPDRLEVYFTIQSYANEISAIVFVTYKNGSWSEPEVAAFSGRFNDLEPSFSTDGLRMYFVSNRPLNETENKTKDYDIWFVDRTAIGGTWSKPINMGAPVNSEDNEFYPSVAQSGNLYFTCDGIGTKGKDDIFMCAFNKGKFDQRISLSDSVNSDGYEFNAFVAPDESYLVYTCYNRKGDVGSGDLYISRKKNNTWASGKNIGGSINSSKMEYCPFVDTKSGILYFTSRRNSVNTKFDKQQTLDDLLREMQRYENGQSRLYQVNFPGLKID